MDSTPGLIFIHLCCNKRSSSCVRDLCSCPNGREVQTAFLQYQFMDLILFISQKGRGSYLRGGHIRRNMVCIIVLFIVFCYIVKCGISTNIIYKYFETI